MLNYAELLPLELEEAWKRNPMAVVPWGALEWHGSHLPLGLDGIVAEEFAKQLSADIDAVLLPTQWLPMTTLPHPHSLDIPAETFRSVVRHIISGLRKAGATTVCLVTGHYAHGHEVVLYECAIEAIDSDFRVLAATPLEILGQPELLDHAGRWETAQFLHYRPDLVHLEHLPDSVEIRRDGVLGESPRLGTATEGREILEKALKAWKRWIENATPTSLFDHYSDSKERFADYQKSYFSDSWEQAIQDWWADRR
jgi:creatinine amidohydrolase